MSFFKSFIRTSPRGSTHVCSGISSVGIDDKSAFVPRIRSRGFFLNFADAGEPWSTFQRGPKFRVLLRLTDGKHFHAAAMEVSDETADAQSPRGSLRAITKAHAPAHYRPDIRR